MGLIKSFLEQGFSPVEGYVCAQCFDDSAIAAFITKNTNNTGCNFCSDRKRKQRPSCDLNSVIEYMLRCIFTEYTDPQNELYYDKESPNGYVGTTFDIYELIEEHLQLEFCSEELKTTIIDSISPQDWCEIDQFGESQDEELIQDWELFSKLIKEDARFVFFKYGTRPKWMLGDEGEVSLSQILDAIGKFVQELDLVQRLNKGTRIVRARPYTGKRAFPLTSKELGPPPHDVSARFPNRMSPAGIPMFYGSLNAKTALAEVADGKNERAVSVQFQTLERLTLIDLTRVPPVPSIFDERMASMRSPLIFLNAFLRDFTKPVKKNGREHVEYVPTQVVTEYFRHIYRHHNDEPVHGIIYPSSRDKGSSCVLFLKNENCIEDMKDVKDGRSILLMNRASAKIKKLD